MAGAAKRRRGNNEKKKKGPQTKVKAKGGESSGGGEHNCLCKCASAPKRCRKPGGKGGQGAKKKGDGQRKENRKKKKAGTEGEKGLGWTVSDHQGAGMKVGRRRRRKITVNRGGGGAGETKDRHGVRENLKRAKQKRGRDKKKGVWDKKHLQKGKNNNLGAKNEPQTTALQGGGS